MPNRVNGGFEGNEVGIGAILKFEGKVGETVKFEIYVKGGGTWEFGSKDGEIYFVPYLFLLTSLIS